MSPQDYCTARILGQPGYYAALFAPPGTRSTVQAMLTIQAELEAIPARCSDPGIAQVKYQWWLTDITRTQTGEPQHPALRALTASAAGRQLPIALLAGLVEGLATPSATERPDPQPAMARPRLVPGAIFGRLLALAGGEQRPAPLQAAEAIGEQLHGSAHTLRRRTAGPNALDPAADEAAHATLMRALQRGYGLQTAALRPHLVLGELRLTQLRRLDRARDSGPNPAVQVHPLRMLWVAWRTARRSA